MTVGRLSAFAAAISGGSPGLSILRRRAPPVTLARVLLRPAVPLWAVGWEDAVSEDDVALDDGLWAWLRREPIEDVLHVERGGRCDVTR